MMLLGLIHLAFLTREQLPHLGLQKYIEVNQKLLLSSNLLLLSILEFLLLRPPLELPLLVNQPLLM